MGSLPEHCERDAPDEVEITPAMVAAGARVLRENCDLAPYWSRSLAKEVFRAMTEVVPKADGSAP
jgi:hypothetical protein